MAKLTYFDKVEIKKRKVHHNQLRAKGLFRQARHCGPKVIARDFGISPSRVHRIWTARETQYFPCFDWMG